MSLSTKSGFWQSHPAHHLVFVASPRSVSSVTVTSLSSMTESRVKFEYVLHSGPTRQLNLLFVDLYTMKFDTYCSFSTRETMHEEQFVDAKTAAANEANQRYSSYYCYTCSQIFCKIYHHFFLGEVLLRINKINL